MQVAGQRRGPAQRAAPARVGDALLACPTDRRATGCDAPDDVNSDNGPRREAAGGILPTGQDGRERIAADRVVVDEAEIDE